MASRLISSGARIALASAALALVLRGSSLAGDDAPVRFPPVRESQRRAAPRKIPTPADGPASPRTRDGAATAIELTPPHTAPIAPHVAVSQGEIVQLAPPGTVVLEEQTPPPYLTPYYPSAADSALDAGAAGERRLRSVLKSSPEPAPRSEPPRSPAVDAALPPHVESRCQNLVREGLALVDRGAIYSGRNLFLRSLSMLAEARDMSSGSCIHSRMLENARDALKCGEDFATQGDRLASEIDVDHLARVHRLNILPATAESATPWVARHLYHDYARKQLAGAVGKSPAASLALYGIGKAAALQARHGADNRARFMAQAITIHQAALDADPKNYLAANELGVLLARNQRWSDARAMFQFAARLRDDPLIWRNLAKTHQQLGETQLAQSASARAGGHSRIVPRPTVQWVPPEQFAATQAPGPASRMSSPVATPATPEPADASPRSAQWNGWLPWRKR